MKYPELADKILTALKEKRGNSPNEIAGFLNLDTSTVKTIMDELKADYKHWFAETKGYGEDHYKLIVTPIGHTDINRILETGGFTQLKAEMLEQQSHKQELDFLQKENLELQNESLKYQLTIRGQEEYIKELTSENLHLQNKNLRLYVLYTLTGFIVGFVTANWQWILLIFKTK